MPRLYIAGIAMTVFGRHLECETATQTAAWTRRKSKRVEPCNAHGAIAVNAVLAV